MIASLQNSVQVKSKYGHKSSQLSQRTGSENVIALITGVSCKIPSPMSPKYLKELYGEQSFNRSVEDMNKYRLNIVFFLHIEKSDKLNKPRVTKQVLERMQKKRAIFSPETWSFNYGTSLPKLSSSFSIYLFLRKNDAIKTADYK
jgi:hypothetical protein